METKPKSKTTDPKAVVLSFLKALNSEKFNAARAYVNSDMAFDGVMGSRDGAEAYFKDMEKMKFKYKIQKTFVDGQDVCVLYTIDMGSATIFTCGWYQLKRHKINNIKVVFDPRPLLNK